MWALWVKGQCWRLSMSHPIKELSKLTPKATSYSECTFSGISTDKDEVAATLALPNPFSDIKLSKRAYHFARYFYCDDINNRYYVKAALLNVLQGEDTGKLAEVTLHALIVAAMREFQNPTTKMNKMGEQEVTSFSCSKAAKSMGIMKQNLTERHKNLLEVLLTELHLWSSEVIHHIKAHQRYNEEQNT